MPANPLLLAHQGGWDEILMVAGPLALLAWLLWLADRRARRMQSGSDEGDPARTDRSGVGDVGAE
ncbi:MAG: hypothetical protein CL441_06905 [Acidimicrobiaceae bacterium]|jgi:cyanate permease|nr:hypothetical protein [Acidimicrobiaceae bacterium]